MFYSDHSEEHGLTEVRAQAPWAGRQRCEVSYSRQLTTVPMAMRLGTLHLCAQLLPASILGGRRVGTWEADARAWLPAPLWASSLLSFLIPRCPWRGLWGFREVVWVRAQGTVAPGALEASLSPTLLWVQVRDHLPDEPAFPLVGLG